MQVCVKNRAIAIYERINFFLYKPVYSDIKKGCVYLISELLHTLTDFMKVCVICPITLHNYSKIYQIFIFDIFRRLCTGGGFCFMTFKYVCVRCVTLLFYYGVTGVTFGVNKNVYYLFLINKFDKRKKELFLFNSIVKD